MIVTLVFFPAVSLGKSEIAQVPGVYPFKLGDFTITVLSDGTLPGSTYAAVEYEPNRNRSPAEKLSVLSRHRLMLS